MKGILIDEGGDIMIRRGAPVIGDCSADVAERVIRAWQGEFKETPLIGGNIDRALNGSVNPYWRGNIATQLRSQHIDVERLEMSESGIQIVIEN